jgi:cytochrome b subunit of formate dehydrogenase
MPKTHNHYLLKFDRILTWVSLVLLIILVITGYGIVNPKVISELTGGILTRPLSLYLHTTLDVPVLVLLMFHVLIQLRFALMRWRVKDGVPLNAFIIILGLFSTVLILLMDATLLRG